MLTIKREGWLWKCLTSGQRSLIETFGTSVCELFWMLFANLLLVLLMITFVVATGFVILPSIIDAALFYMGFESFIEHQIVMMSFTINSVTGVLVIFYIVHENYDNGSITIPSLVKEYVKAKKEKVCPVVRVDSSTPVS